MDPTQRENEILCCQGNVWQQAGRGAEHFRFVEEIHIKAVSVFASMKVMYMRLEFKLRTILLTETRFNTFINY